MKMPFIFSQLLAFSLGLSAPVFAAPGEGAAESQPRLEILAPAAGAVSASCAAPGALCITAGSATTLMVPPPIVATATGAVIPPLPPQFTRPPSALRAEKNSDSAVPWTVEVQAALRQPALAGNALFLVYDAQDPGALVSHEVTSLQQAPVAAGNRIMARIGLSPDDGFRAGRYLIQVAQIVNGKEIVLAEGELRLQ